MEPDSEQAAIESLFIYDTPDTPEAAPEDTAEAVSEAPDDVEAGPADDAPADQQEAPEDEASEPEAEQQPQTYRVKADGEDVEVTLDELLRGYSRESTFTKRMQEAAAQRKQAEALYHALNGEMQRVTALAQTVQTQGLMAPPTPPDPKLAESDPTAYVRQRAAFEAKAQAYLQQQSQLRQVQERQAAVTQAAMDAHLQEQARALADRIPEFAKPETAKAAKERLTRIGQDYGYSPEELGAITDARAVHVLSDAAKWRELQASKAQARVAPTPQPSRHVPPVPRRAEPPQLAYARAVEKHKANPTEESALALILGGNP